MAAGAVAPFLCFLNVGKKNPVGPLHSLAGLAGQSTDYFEAFVTTKPNRTIFDLPAQPDVRYGFMMFHGLGSCVVKNDSQGVPISGMYLAYPMLHMGPVIASTSFYRAKLCRE